MKKIETMIMALAALVMTACSSNDELAPVQPKTKQMAVTLNANYEGMRAAFDPSTKKMTFKEGDVLHLEGDYDNNGESDIVGNLTLTTGAGTTSATFTGSLTVPSEYTGDDILNEDITFIIYLFPSTWKTDGYYILNDDGYVYGSNPWNKIKPTLQEVVEKFNNIVTSCEKPRINFTKFSMTDITNGFFNCEISGLDPNTDYKVEMGPTYGGSKEPFTDGTITSDATGVAKFAAFTSSGSYEGLYIDIKRWDSGSSDWVFLHEILLGDKTIEGGKIYNIKRSVL